MQVVVTRMTAAVSIATVPIAPVSAIVSWGVTVAATAVTTIAGEAVATAATVTAAAAVSTITGETENRHQSVSSVTAPALSQRRGRSNRACDTHPEHGHRCVSFNVPHALSPADIVPLSC